MLVVSCLLLVSPSNSATYYVDSEDTTGNVDGDGSEGTPWQTITWAMSQVSSGDLVIVFTGEFTESMSGSSETFPITIPAGVHLSAEVVVNEAATVDAESNNLQVFDLTATSTVEGLHIISATNGTTSDGLVYLTGKGFVTDNTIIATGTTAYGVYVADAADNSVISGNTITANAASDNGITLASNADTITIQSNTIDATGSSASGIYVNSGCDNLGINNNTITADNATGSGINLISTMGTGISIAGNTINGGLYGIKSGLVNAAISIAGNTIIGNDTASSYGYGNSGSNNNYLGGTSTFSTNEVRNFAVGFELEGGWGGRINIYQNTIVRNTTGIVAIREPNIYVKDSIIAYDPAGGIATGTGISKEHDGGTDLISVTYSDVYGNATDFNNASGAVITRSDNVNLPAGFADADNHDYRISDDSPCAGAGDGGVDMGAYGTSGSDAGFQATSYVNASTGNDSTGDGSEGSPWKTIGKALTLTTNTCNVAAGTYDDALGETFPIRIPRGITLQSNASPTTLAIIDSESNDVNAITLTLNSVVDGFTIQSADNGSTSDGLVYLEEQATASDNTLTVTGTTAYAVYVADAADSSTISGNTITANSEDDVGVCLASNADTISIENNTIGATGTNGIGIYASGSCDTLVIDLNSIEATGTDGKGIQLLNTVGTGLTITSNTIEASLYGIQHGFTANATSLNVSSNRVLGNNTANSFGFGNSGANNNYVGAASTFSSNEVTSFETGVELEGGWSSTWNVTHSTIIGNTTGIDLSREPGITITNCIIAFDPDGATDTGTGVAKTANGGPDSVSVTYSDVYGNSTNFSTTNGSAITLGDGTIEATADFVDSANNDYRLLGTSPCIDAGTPEGSDMGAYQQGDTTGPTLAITAPDGGELWAGGSNQDISFTASDAAGLSANTLNLYYSTDEGTTYTSIATSQSNTSPYSWTLPTTVSTTNARVKIDMEDIFGNIGTDESDANFTIDSTTPEVTLTDPTGGELIQGGSSFDIAFSATDDLTAGGNILMTFKYSSNEGTSWVTIATAQANTSPYSWSVPSITSSEVRVRVEATDEANNMNYAESTANITIDATVPTDPSAIYPTTGISTSDATPAFSWNASVDSLSGISSYEVRIDGVVVSTQDSTATYTPGTDLTDASHTWDARGKNNAGLWSGWSAVQTFTVDATAPTAPTPTYPTTGIATSDATLTFTWGASVDSVSGVVSYEVRVDGLVVSTQGATTTYTPGTDLTDASHTWEARGKNGVGLWSTWGATQTFTVDTSGPAVGAITLSDPVRGDTSYSSTIEVTVEASSIVGSPSQMRMAENAGFSTNDTGWIGYSLTYLYTLEATEGTHEVFYFLRDATLNESATVSATIIVDTISPEVGSTEIKDTDTGSQVISNSLTISIEASGVSADAVSMRVAENTGFTTNDTGWIAYAQSYEYAFTGSDGVKTAFYKVRDSASNESGVASATIEVDTAGPNAPVLSTPTNNSSTNDATPEFVWQAVTGGASYEVRLAGTIVATTSSLSYTHTTTLSDATYTWEVRARDLALNYGVYSTTWTFILDTTQIDPTNISVNIPEEDVPIDDGIEITFPATMDTESVEDAFNLDSGAGGSSVRGKAAVAGTFTWTADNKTMTFSPTNDLSAGTTYTLSIGTGAKDAFGNALSSAFSTTFTTATGDDEVPTIAIKIRDRELKDNDYIPEIPTFQIEVSDNVAIRVEGVILRLNGIPVGLTTVSTTSTTVELSYAPSGALVQEFAETHSITVEATDVSGNVATKEVLNLKVSDGTAKITGGVLTHPTQYAPLGGGVLKVGYQLSTDAQVNIYLISKYGVIHWTHRAAAAAEGGKAGYNEVEFNGTSDTSRSTIPNGLYMVKVISQNKVIGSGHVMVLD